MVEFENRLRMLKKDNIATGVVVALGSEILSGAILWIVLAVIGEPFEDHLKLLGVCFVAPILLLRYYSKSKECPMVTKTIIVVLFVTFIAYMFAVKPYLS